MKPQELLPVLAITVVSALAQQYQQHPPQVPPQMPGGQPMHGQPMQGGQPMHGQHQMPRTEGGHRFKEGARDRQHVMEHLDGMVQSDRQPDQMSEDEVQFHYFKLHDYNNDNKLDGIELVSALTHYHKEEEANNNKPLSDADLINLVDTILKEDDRNNDGYIDYAEFIVSQRT